MSKRQGKIKLQKKRKICWLLFYSGNLHKANSDASGPDAHFGEYEILPTDMERGPRGGTVRDESDNG